MPLTANQKHYIKKNIQKLDLRQIADDLNLPEKEILRYARKHWPDKKYKNSSASKNFSVETSRLAVESFNFKDFIADNINIFILLFILIFIVYFNSLNNAFVSDDIAGILKNPDLGNFGSIFSGSFIGSLRKLIFFFPYKISFPSPVLFRIINILFHLGSVFLVYTILNLLSKRPIAILASVLFAIHPVLSEPIVWISGGTYVQCAFFMLLAFLFYILSEKTPKYFYYSLGALLLSLLTSEKAMVFFIILIFYELSFGNIKKNWKKIIPFLAIGIIFIMLSIANIGKRTSDIEAMSHNNNGGLYNPLIQVPVAMSNYLWLVFWPQKLTLYHTEMGFTAVQYIIMLITFLVYLGVIFYGWKKNKPVFFWLSFLIITLLPTLTPLKIAWIVAERYAYLGYLGIFVIIAIFFDWLVEKYRHRKDEYRYAIYSVFTVIILMLSVRTIVRNIDWKNEDNLWIATAKVSPSGPNIHNNLGDVYGRQGDLERSAEEFKKAIEINPNYADAYHNLGNAYRDMKKYDLALENYQKALSINPGLWQSYENIAAIYFEQGNIQGADEMIKKALGINPHSPELQNNLKLIESKINQK